MPSIESPTPRRRSWLWSVGIGGLLFAGLAAGYLLPPDGLSKVETPVARPAYGTTSSPTDPIESELRDANAVVTHEFALSAADVRDTQEAPAVAIDSEDRICLAWASKTGDGERTLYVATSDDSGSTFTGPRVVRKSGIFKSSSSTGKGGGFERRMIPLLSSCGEVMLLAWGEAPADGSAIRMVLAESRDGGRTFSEPTCVHQSDDARPTFNGLAASSRGRVVCCWLDSRNGAQQPFASIRLASDLQFGGEKQVHEGAQGGGVCPCCLTAAAVGDDGMVFVAFRNQLDGYRDIWLSRRLDSDVEFSEAVPVAMPTWQFDGCPHDGPSLEICQGHVHVAWMDGRSGKQRVYHGWAPTSDLQFAVAPLHASGPGTQGNAKLRADTAGRLHAVWEESIADEAPTDRADAKNRHGGHQHIDLTGPGRVIMHAVSPEADGHFSVASPIVSRSGRFQTRPAIACGKRGMAVAWNELDESGKRVVVAFLAGSSDPPLKPFGAEARAK
jgi:hypothetical protein